MNNILHSIYSYRQLYNQNPVEILTLDKMYYPKLSRSFFIKVEKIQSFLKCVFSGDITNSVVNYDIGLLIATNDKIKDIKTSSFRSDTGMSKIRVVFEFGKDVYSYPNCKGYKIEFRHNNDTRFSSNIIIYVNETFTESIDKDFEKSLLLELIIGLLTLENIDFIGDYDSYTKSKAIVLDSIDGLFPEHDEKFYRSLSLYTSVIVDAWFTIMCLIPEGYYNSNTNIASSIGKLFMKTVFGRVKYNGDILVLKEAKELCVDIQKFISKYSLFLNENSIGEVNDTLVNDNKSLRDFLFTEFSALMISVNRYLLFYIDKEKEEEDDD